MLPASFGTASDNSTFRTRSAADCARSGAAQPPLHGCGGAALRYSLRLPRTPLRFPSPPAGCFVPGHCFVRLSPPPLDCARKCAALKRRHSVASANLGNLGARAGGNSSAGGARASNLATLGRNQFGARKRASPRLRRLVWGGALPHCPKLGGLGRFAPLHPVRPAFRFKVGFRKNALGRVCVYSLFARRALRFGAPGQRQNCTPQRSRCLGCAEYGAPALKNYLLTVAFLLRCCPFVPILNVRWVYDGVSQLVMGGES